MRSYRCNACGRSYVAVGNTTADEVACACTARLEEHPLPSGVHELHVSPPVAARAAPPAPEPAQPKDRTPKEPDQGYGASHGYGDAHGGPSGPGDAPAPVPANHAPPPDPDAQPE